MKITLATLKQRLSSYHPPHNPHVQKRASILITVFEKEGNLFLYLTERSENLRSHSGQVAFPGGQQEKSDVNAQQTALRETWEEIGLDPKEVEMIGEIDQIVSRHYYLVSSFVGLISSSFSSQFNASEISSVFTVPIDFFMNADNHTSRTIYDQKIPHTFHHFQYEDYDIWGLTSLLILQFLEVGFGYVPEYSVHPTSRLPWMELCQRYREGLTWEELAKQGLLK